MEPSSLPSTDAERRACLDRLTPAQLDVLRLVAAYKSSKEIARELGISPHTVDQRVRRIQTLLGVASRFEAARVYSSTPQSPPNSSQAAWGDLIYQPSALVSEPTVADTGLSGVGNPADDGPAVLHFAQAAYAVDAGDKADRSAWYSVLLESGSANDLNAWARTAIIAALTLAALLSVAAAVSLAEGLSRLF